MDPFVSKEPFGNFKHWFDIACQKYGLMESHAMALATATKDGKPSVRMVILGEFNSQGFKFFTNFSSRKGKELEENPQASLCFYWSNEAAHDNILPRQIRIEGEVVRLSQEESTKHFHEYPKERQITATIGHQSAPLDSRQVLLDRQKELEEQYKDADRLPNPDYSGGYLLKPNVFEFNQLMPNYADERILFTRKPGATDNESEDSWTMQRLYP